MASLSFKIRNIKKQERFLDGDSRFHIVTCLTRATTTAKLGIVAGNIHILELRGNVTKRDRYATS